MVMSIMLSGHCRGVAWDGQGNEILEHHSPMMVNSWKVIEPFPRGGIWELRNKLVVRKGSSLPHTGLSMETEGEGRDVLYGAVFRAEKQAQGCVNQL